MTDRFEATSAEHRPEGWTEDDEHNLGEAMAAEHRHDVEHDRMFDFDVIVSTDREIRRSVLAFIERVLGPDYDHGDME